MVAKPRNTKQEQIQISAALRAEGATWAQVAEEFSRRYRINARVALRLAHGWSQPEAAGHWNARWPDDPKTFKNFSIWELWPGPTGHPPSVPNLDRLAQLYECHVADVLRDLPDYGAGAGGPGEPDGSTLTPADAQRLLLDLFGCVPEGECSPYLPARSEITLLYRLKEIDFHDLAKVIMVWAQWLNPLLSRRAALSKLGAAFTLAAAAPLLDLADHDEVERIAGVLAEPRRLDEATVSYAESALLTFRHQSNALGPQTMLPVVLAQRQAMARLVDAAPEHLRPRVLAVHGDLSQLVGWQLFNLGDYRAAQHYYEEARTAADDAQYLELASYSLCSMAHLAIWQGRPRVAIDHVIAAQAWASKSGSWCARGCAADFAARAYAADGQADSCRSALEIMRASVNNSKGGAPAPSWAWTLNEQFYWSIKGECLLRLGRPDETLAAAETALSLIEPTDLHNYLHTVADQAEAHIQQADPASASRILGDVVTMAEGYRSQRLEQRVVRMRTDLDQWRRNQAVRALDEKLAHYWQSIGSPTTTLT